MQSNILQEFSFTIPSCSEITILRQFQEPSLYQAIGISLLKLIARYIRYKDLQSKLYTTFQDLKNEIINCLPSYKPFIDYYYQAIDLILKYDNEVLAFKTINEWNLLDGFHQWISVAIKGLLLIITKKYDDVKLDLENDKNFSKNNFAIFTSLMNAFNIAIKLYFFNNQPETFYPNKIGIYPFMHILFNEVENNMLTFNAYIEVYTNELYKLEIENTISVQQLEIYPFSYSNEPKIPVGTEVSLPALVLDILLFEIIKTGNELPIKISQKIKTLAGKSEGIATLPSLKNKIIGNSIIAQVCDVCREVKDIKYFPISSFRNCEACIKNR
ncbi:hypothetical protein SteCoe_32855 [Stentor coeruleus]|uniref:Uncharacterized protein n=1 Tax=Stentor coeruleus TaxID=5963 RepID=A0A1R2AY11_9CILI|nr:hypothetical protein SteCoe_32855 [Stentor coeruleus]